MREREWRHGRSQALGPEFFMEPGEPSWSLVFCALRRCTPSYSPVDHSFIQQFLRAYYGLATVLNAMSAMVRGREKGRGRDEEEGREGTWAITEQIRAGIGYDQGRHVTRKTQLQGKDNLINSYSKTRSVASVFVHLRHYKQYSSTTVGAGRFVLASLGLRQRPFHQPYLLTQIHETEGVEGRQLNIHKKRGPSFPQTLNIKIRALIFLCSIFAMLWIICITFMNLTDMRKNFYGVIILANDTAELNE